MSRSRFADGISPMSRHLLKTATLCLFLALAGCEDENPDHYLKEGIALMDQGDFESARVQFRNALQLEPKLAEAYYRLALIDENRQDIGSMLLKLQEALAIEPEHLGANLKLAQLYLSGGQYQETTDLIQRVLQTHPHDTTALLLLASIQFRQGQPAAAQQAVERVLAAEPFLADAIGLQVNILSTLGRVDEALALSAVGVEHNADDSGLWIQKIRLQVEQKQIAQAEQDYQSLIKRFPLDPQYPLAFAELLRTQAKLQQAEQFIREAVKKYPGEMAYQYKLVDIIEQRDAQEAEQVLRSLGAEFPDDVGLKLRLAELLLAQQKFKEAEQLLQALATHDDDQVAIKVKIKLAGMALMQKQPAKVEQLAEEILQLDVNQSDALLLRAGMRLNRLDAEGAIADLRVVLRDRPYLEQAMLLMAQANSVKGESEVAESHLRKMLDFNPNSRTALIPLANELLKRGDLARAEEMTLKEVNLNPGQQAPLELLIQLKTLRKDWTGAAKALEALRKIPDAAETAQYWAAHLAAAQGHTELAVKAYQALLTRHGEHTQALMDLAQLYEASGRRAEWITYLQTLLAKKPDSVAVLSVLAAACILEQRLTEAETYVRRASEAAPADVGLTLKWVDVIELQNAARAETALKAFMQKDPGDARLVFRLARHYQEHERIPEAEATLQAFAEQYPDSRNAVNARFQLAQLAWLRQDLPEAKSRVSQLLIREPRNVDALLLRAALSLAEPAYPAVFADLYRALEIRPDAEQALVLMAQAYQLQGQTQNVEETWRRVLLAHPGNMTGLRFLLEKGTASGDIQQALSYIDRAIKANPGNPAYLELKFQWQLSRQDWLGATATLDDLKKWPQTGERVLAWQAQLAMQQGEYPKAIEHWTALFQTMPANPDVLANIVQAYQKAGQANQLMAFLKATIQRTPGFDEAYRWLSRAYATAGDWTQAEKVLRDKLSRTPADSQTWALLANLFASQDNPAEAEKTFQAGLAATHDDFFLLNALATFQIMRREFDKAITVYEAALVKYPDNVMASNNLAEMLVNHKADDPAALTRALELVANFKNANDPVLLDTYAWVHVKTGEVAMAIPLLKQALERLPDNQTFRYHLAEAHARLGEKTTALEHLQQLLHQPAAPDFLDREAAQALFNQLQ